MTALSWVALAAATVAVVAWLVVSFSAPGRRRATAEWSATVALYVALAAFFAHWARGASLEQRTGALLGFAALAALFSAGGILAVARLIGHLRRRDARRLDATQ